MTIVSVGTVSTAKRPTAGPTSTIRSGVTVLRDARRDERAEREPREHDRQVADALARVRERGERIVGLAVAVVERAFGGAHAAIVEAHRHVASAKNVFASVCTTLLSSVPPSTGFGCAISAMPACGAGGMFSATSSGPAGPGIV